MAYYEKSHILESVVIKRTSAECTALLHSAPLHEVSSISEQASRLGTCETASNVTQRVCFNLRVCTSLLLSADSGLKSCTLKLCACERHYISMLCFCLSHGCKLWDNCSWVLSDRNFLHTNYLTIKKCWQLKNVKACNLIFFGVF